MYKPNNDETSYVGVSDSRKCSSMNYVNNIIILNGMNGITLQYHLQINPKLSLNLPHIYVLTWQVKKGIMN